MPQFRLKSDVVEARLWKGGAANASPIINWILESGSTARWNNPLERGEPDHIAIDNLSGTIRVDRGDWIVQVVKGAFYPCPPYIFEATYEEIVEKGIGD